MKTLILGTAVVTMLMAGGTAARADLVANGNFATGDFTGWTTSGSGISIDTVYAAPGDTYDAAFGGDGILSQTIATQPGSTYALSFSLLDESGLFGDTFTVTFGSVSYVITGDTAPDYTTEEFSFSASDITDTSTQLSFQGYNPNSDWNLDDVSLVAVTNPIPEPASATLLAGGLLLAAVRRRKSAPRLG